MSIILAVILVFEMTFQSLPTFQAVRASDTQFVGEIDDGPTEILPGCSWYCGGFVSGYNSSSSLSSKNSISYSPENAHDFDITTAWAEGKADYGIGEYIEYSFDMSEFKGEHHLGITTIILANGYKKTKKLWNENSRVKKLKMYVDDRPFALLELIDCFEFQTIGLDTIMLPQQAVMRFRFEVVDVYPGTKYKDTAISELLFDGVGVH